MKTIAEYLIDAPGHQKEGRDWSHVEHADLEAWNQERTKLMARMAELEKVLAWEAEAMRSIQRLDLPQMAAKAKEKTE